MTENQVFNFAEAVAYAGVSRQRLRHAMKSGALPSRGGGKPGTLLEIQERDLVRWCHQAKVILPTLRQRRRPVRPEDWQQRYEAILEGFEDIMQCLRRLTGDLMGLETRLMVLDHKVCEKIQLICPPKSLAEQLAAQNAERLERSVAEN